MPPKKHTNEFLVHKYWGRKNYSNVHDTLAPLLHPGDVLWDPFCGSGVASVAASRLGATVYANDINPIACAITTLATSNIPIRKVMIEGEGLLERMRASFPTFAVGDDAIRYFIHARKGECKSCSATFNHSTSTLVTTCSACGGRLRFIGDDDVDATLVGANLASAGSVDFSHPLWNEVVSRWMLLNRFGKSCRRSLAVYDVAFVENKRTLTTMGTRLSRFFTPFAFSVLGTLAEYVHNEIQEPSVKNALLLLVTGASAQVSRLIPFRNNMTTGGPAWSVPGFWVPPIHLECNPFERLQTRLEKMQRALLDAAKSNASAAPVYVYNQSTSSQIEIPLFDADLVFIDPPYAGDVPYLEFSAIWNAFFTRGKRVDYSNEIVVSDRVEPTSTHSQYSENIAKAFQTIVSRLKPGGRIVLTFNNLSGAAWFSVLDPLQALGFRVDDVSFREPAVKSAKSQFAPRTSYVGDFYIVFRYSTKPLATSVDKITENSIRRLFHIRGMECAQVNTVRTVAILNLLIANATAAAIARVDDSIERCCSIVDGICTLRNSAQSPRDSFDTYLENLIEQAESRLQGEFSLDDIIREVTKIDRGQTFPTPAEIGKVLESRSRPSLFETINLTLKTSSAENHPPAV